MTTAPSVELEESKVGLWLRERRVRVALLVGLVESVAVVAGGLRWFWVVAFAVAAVAFHYFVGRKTRFLAVREVSWIAATSQLISLVVPLLWELVKFLAIVVLVLMALGLLVMLLAERR